MIVGPFDAVLNYWAYIAKAIATNFVFERKSQFKILS